LLTENIFSLQFQISTRVTSGHGRTFSRISSKLRLLFDCINYLTVLSSFMLVVWAVGAAVTYMMLPVNWFMETIGFLAVFTEAMLGEFIEFLSTFFFATNKRILVAPGLPQFLRNYKNKSTHGMSFLMVIMWTIGDFYKTTYFILRSAPMQFWICGMLQVGNR
jgi:uncharacterized protein with PQ loop repeat